MEWIYMVQASSGSGWLLLLLLIVICLLPDVLLAMWEYYNSQQGVVLNMVGSSHLLLTKYIFFNLKKNYFAETFTRRAGASQIRANDFVHEPEKVGIVRF